MFARQIIKLSKLLLLLTFFVSCFSAYPNQAVLDEANTALKKQNYALASTLFKQLQNQKDFKTDAHFGLAQANLFMGDLDLAEDQINKVIDAITQEADHYFIAARIAGRQAQEANYFSKIGYAKDTKKYFKKALEIDEKHAPSVIGLIRFHQQAPTIAGGDKASIPELIAYLWQLDAREAFFFEVPNVLRNSGLKQALNLYEKAVCAESRIEKGRFHYDFAMVLSNNGFYKAALEQLLEIDINAYAKQPAFYHMRFYQIAKTAAESDSQLELGLNSIIQYQAFSIEDKAISADWVSFRNAQLTYLIGKNEKNHQRLTSLAKHTEDADLKKKISVFLGNT